MNKEESDKWDAYLTEKMKGSSLYVPEPPKPDLNAQLNAQAEARIKAEREGTYFGSGDDNFDAEAESQD